ncbi:MAG TPA: hypothetical protein ENI95_02055, partial [Chloroflexi bacterium]|nr:hypothetical protein [Chloroflexota bacterium]
MPDMEEEMRPSDPSDQQPDPSEEAQDEEKQHKTKSRLERLMSAGEKAKEEAEHWKRIEELGIPVPSHDRDRETTGPLTEEPPHQEDDTSTGQETPPRGMPPLKTEQSSRPSRQRPVEIYPHPTDGPIPPLSPSDVRAGGLSPDASLLSEPPLPDDEQGETKGGIIPSR